MKRGPTATPEPIDIETAKTSKTKPINIVPNLPDMDPDLPPPSIASSAPTSGLYYMEKIGKSNPSSFNDFTVGSLPDRKRKFNGHNY